MTRVEESVSTFLSPTDGPRAAGGEDHAAPDDDECAQLMLAEEGPGVRVEAAHCSRRREGLAGYSALPGGPIPRTMAVLEPGWLLPSHRVSVIVRWSTKRLPYSMRPCSSSAVVIFRYGSIPRGAVCGATPWNAADAWRERSSPRLRIVGHHQQIASPELEPTVPQRWSGSRKVYSKLFFMTGRIALADRDSRAHHVE